MGRQGEPFPCGVEGRHRPWIPMRKPPAVSEKPCAGGGVGAEQRADPRSRYPDAAGTGTAWCRLQLCHRQAGPPPPCRRRPGEPRLGRLRIAAPAAPRELPCGSSDLWDRLRSCPGSLLRFPATRAPGLRRDHAGCPPGPGPHRTTVPPDRTQDRRPDRPAGGSRAEQARPPRGGRTPTALPQWRTRFSRCLPGSSRRTAPVKAPARRKRQCYARSPRAQGAPNGPNGLPPEAPASPRKTARHRPCGDPPGHPPSAPRLPPRPSPAGDAAAGTPRPWPWSSPS